MPLPRRSIAAALGASALLATTVVAAGPAAAAAPAPVTGTATAVGSVATPVPAANFAASLPGVAADPEASPPGVNPASCAPSAAHPYPVVLINGTFEVMQNSFDFLGPRLAAAGYCVYGYNYGGTPGQSVQATGPVEAGVRALGAEVGTVETRTGASKVDLVGYSQGGLIAELYTKFGGAGNVHAVTALAPTTHGTTLDGIATLAKAVPGALALESAEGCQACTDQVRGSAVVRKLDDGPIAVAGIPYTVIDTRYEDVVTPTGSSFIREPGVTNQYVQSFSATDTDEHVDLPFDPVTAGLVLAALHRADPS